MKKVGAPWLRRSLTSGSARQMRRTSSTGSRLGTSRSFAYRVHDLRVQRRYRERDAFWARHRAAAHAVGRGRGAARASPTNSDSTAFGASITSSRCTARARASVSKEHDARGVERNHRARPAGLAHRGHDVPSSCGVRGRGDHDRPRVGRPARTRVRRGVVRSRAPRAGDPVPAAQANASTGSKRRCRSCAACSRPTTSRSKAGTSASSTRRCCPARCNNRTRRSGSVPSGEKRMMPIAARYADVWHSWGSPESMAEKSQRISAHGRSAPDAIRPRSCGRRRCRSKTISTRSRATSTRGAGAGIGYLVCGWPATGRPAVKRFARTFPRNGVGREHGSSSGPYLGVLRACWCCRAVAKLRDPGRPGPRPPRSGCLGGSRHGPRVRRGRNRSRWPALFWGRPGRVRGRGHVRRARPRPRCDSCAGRRRPRARASASPSAPVTAGPRRPRRGGRSCRFRAGTRPGPPLAARSRTHPGAALVLGALVGCCVALFGDGARAGVDGRR